MSFKYTPLTSDNPVLFTPPSEEQLAGKAKVFKVVPPTPLHEDQLTSHLAVLGHTRVTEDDIRAAMINACFEIWDDEAEAEEIANFLESVWQRNAMYNQLLNDWLEKDRERRLDIAAGAPHMPPEPMPEALVKARDKARHVTLIRQIQQNSVNVRLLAVQQNNTAQTSNDLMVRMHVLPEAKNFEFKHGRNELGILHEEDVSRMRQAMTSDDYTSLLLFIDGLYSFSKEEEGNLNSPSESDLDLISSAEPSEESGSKSGSSKASNTEPAPTAE